MIALLKILQTFSDEETSDLISFSVLWQFNTWVFASSGFFINNQLNGYCNEYHNNGNIKHKGLYKLNKIMEEAIPLAKKEDADDK